jgi:hypothetical protein
MDHSASSLLRDIGLGIVFAAAASHAARLLRQPLLLGYVFGGILLGSRIGFGLVTDQASIELISEIGLILLLFIIGLEINLRELARMGRTMFGLGCAQFVACVLLGLACLRPLGYGIGRGNFDLLYLAVALALTAGHAQRALLLHAAGAAILGPMVEALISHAGGFHYLVPGVFGVPVWLPALYLNAAVAGAAVDRWMLDRAPEVLRPHDHVPG